MTNEKNVQVTTRPQIDDLLFKRILKQIFTLISLINVEVGINVERVQKMQNQ